MLVFKNKKSFGDRNNEGENLENSFLKHHHSKWTDILICLLDTSITQLAEPVE